MNSGAFTGRMSRSLRDAVVLPVSVVHRYVYWCKVSPQISYKSLENKEILFFNLSEYPRFGADGGPVRFRPWATYPYLATILRPIFTMEYYHR